MDLHQLWTIVSLPDNVPIVLLLFVVPFYTWYAMRQAFANDPWIAGGHALADHRGADGDSVHRHQPAGQRLLHFQAAQVFHPDVYFRFHRAMGHHDRDRHIDSRAWLDVVLAGDHMGS